MTSEIYGDRVFGMNDLKITNIGGTTQEDLVGAQTLSVKPVLKGGILEGDDADIAAHYFVTRFEGEFSAGTYSSAAVAIMMGITLGASGTTPNEVVTLKINQAQRMPYFKVYGKALDDDAGDMHILLAKCKLTDIDGFKMENGNWRITKASILALDDGTNGIARILQNETAAALPAT